MQATFRPGILEDAQACGAVFYDAFKLIAEQHNFPVDFPQPESAGRSPDDVALTRRCVLGGCRDGTRHRRE